MTEDLEDYKRVEVHFVVGYGLANGEIRAYLVSFNDTVVTLIDEIVDYAEIYRKKHKIRVAV